MEGFLLFEKVTCMGDNMIMSKIYTDPFCEELFNDGEKDWVYEVHRRECAPASDNDLEVYSSENSVPIEDGYFFYDWRNTYENGRPQQDEDPVCWSDMRCMDTPHWISDTGHTCMDLMDEDGPVGYCASGFFDDDRDILSLLFKGEHAYAPEDNCCACGSENTMQDFMAPEEGYDLCLFMGDDGEELSNVVDDLLFTDPIAWSYCTNYFWSGVPEDECPCLNALTDYTNDRSNTRKQTDKMPYTFMKQFDDCTTFDSIEGDDVDVHVETLFARWMMCEEKKHTEIPSPTPPPRSEYYMACMEEQNNRDCKDCQGTFDRGTQTCTPMENDEDVDCTQLNVDKVATEYCELLDHCKVNNKGVCKMA